MYKPKKNRGKLPEGVAPKMMEIPDITDEWVESFSNDVTMPSMKEEEKPDDEKFVKLYEILKDYRKREKKD